MEDSVDGVGIRSEVECFRLEWRFSSHLNIPQLLSIYQREEIFNLHHQNMSIARKI